MNHIIDQLVDIYQNKEGWHIKKLSYEDSSDYFIRLIASGNIIVCENEGVVHGYVEFFRVTPSQLIKIIDRDFYVYDENISDGPICYINGIYINKEFRNSIALKFLKKVFFKVNEGCRYFVGIDSKRNRRLRIKGELNYGKRKNNY